MTTLLVNLTILIIGLVLAVNTGKFFARLKSKKKVKKQNVLFFILRE